MRPPFLTSPGAWMHAQRQHHNPSDANPFRRCERPSRLADAAYWLVAVALLGWLGWTVLAAYRVGALT